MLPFFGTPTDSSLFRYSSGQFLPTLTDSSFSRYSSGCYHFSVLPHIRPFSDTGRESFFDTHTDSTFSRYSPGFYHFFVLPTIRPFSGTRGESFWILVRIVPFHGTRLDSTIFRYSHRFDRFPLPVRTVFGYSHEFYIFLYSSACYNFSVLPQIRPFSGIGLESLLTLARILPFPGTRPDSTIFRYSHRFDPFPVLVGTVLEYSHGFYLFPVHAPILSFFGTPTDSTLFQYSLGKFFDTSTDSTFSPYSPGFYRFSVFS